MDKITGAWGNNNTGTFEKKTDINGKIRHPKNSKEYGDTCAKSGLKDIGGGNGSQASEHRGNKPVKRCNRQEKPLIPYTRETVSETF